MINPPLISVSASRREAGFRRCLIDFNMIVSLQGRPRAAAQPVCMRVGAGAECGDRSEGRWTCLVTGTSYRLDEFLRPRLLRVVPDLYPAGAEVDLRLLHTGD